ncbi:uncharacterized protein BDW47DRAFT_17005 [Aspergillus candidus]|uniref:Uncharacterized protein n=1 Tax=Aspergillus candidus TaxID=41067 RepID=A0A2I2FEV4_ASPCN|nr:hypothetical protein BDW47DRAFT_17005 [Aspergillus candidus]PLB39173.1 hypothetical protein BDW47DRAFT_17005 [Aspergillus candidus]
MSSCEFNMPTVPPQRMEKTSPRSRDRNNNQERADPPPFPTQGERSGEDTRKGKVITIEIDIKKSPSGYHHHQT